MTYVTPNFKTKKALKDAIAKGDKVTIFEPGVGTAPESGKVYLEGPHSPAPHTWYAVGIVANGKLVKVT